jgi:hypothetical protein
MGALPTTIAFETTNFRSIDNTMQSRALNGKRFSRKVESQRFGFSVKYRNMNRTEFASIYAFVMSLRGRYNPFTVLLPDLRKTLSGSTAVPTVNGAISAGASSVVLSDASMLSSSGGEIIKFAEHDKVYMTTSISGSTVTFIPELRTASANGADVTISAVPVTVVATSDVQSYPLGRANRYNFQIDCEEDL